MSTRWILSWSSPAVLAVCLAGCGGTSSTTQGANEPDPVTQAIEQNVQSKGPQVIPQGHEMNSGGDIVPIEKTDSDNQ